jgi:hypothetical protein
MDEFEKKIKKKLEEMRADILSKTKIPSKIHDVESISIHTDILKLIERALDKIQKGKALPFKLSELLSEKMLIKHTTRANLIFKILFRG